MNSISLEAFQGKRRKIVVLFCFMISSAIIASIIVFVDSYSMETWNSCNDVGPVSLVTLGSGIDSEIDEFRKIQGIDRAAPIRGTFAHFVSNSLGLLWQANTFAMGYDEEFMESFPTIFALVEGQFPANDSELAISVLLAKRLYVEVGDQVNYSFSSINSPNPSFRPTIISGIFEHGEKDYVNSYYYIRGHAIFHSSLSHSMAVGFIYANVDRSKVVAYNPAESLAYLNDIDEEIRRLDVIYARARGTSQYSTINFLSDGIKEYMAYLTNLRVSQILRSGGVILLELAVIYLAINHIWSERENEVSLLVARGASQFRINIMISIEILIIAILSILPGFVVGVVVSRFAVASDGFLGINFQKILVEPLLISFDSVFYSVVGGIVLPLIVLIIYQMRGRLKITVREKSGRLARITRALRSIRGDVVLLTLSSAFLIALNIGGPAVTQDPFLLNLLSFLPFTLFFGMTSLALKGMRRGTNQLSRAFGFIVGKIPASVGIRRIGKVTASSGPLIIVLVLAMSLAWNCAINDATLPYTRMNQSRFAIGGDLAFHLDSSESDQWDSFIGNLTSRIPSSTGSLISMLSLSLSTGTEGSFEFTAISPYEYSRVGYDSVGNQLNESSLGPLMEQLEIMEFGAIITQDIAEQYDLSTGGFLRAFWRNETDLEALEFSIISVVQALPDTLTFKSGYNPYPGSEWTYNVGTGKIWVRKDDVDNIFSKETNAAHVFCMRVGDQMNATLTTEEYLANGGMEVLENQEWASSFREVDIYVSQDIYVLDRSSDTLMTILSVGTIIGAFIVYALEEINSRKREIALLRSLGAKRNLVIKIQASEMIVLLLISVILLGLFTPVLSVNSLLAAVQTYGGVTYIYPAPLTILTPWLLMAIILAFFIFCISIFIVVVALSSSRINLSQSLNSTWTEVGPYVEGS
ncbi:FtsX-like permease family protein [Candidatus Thorarchaeota archaeon]|nr:MAG: FtsX-like permease family protein [Candidatus Thorarchaeota archaeon]